jgi:hypothetical protein
MKRILITFIALTTLMISSCGPSKPLTPEEQILLNHKIEYYTKLFENQQYVLEANTVYSKKGRSFRMNSTINFVKIDKDNSIIQLGFNQIQGWNGVGGITLEGNVRNYKVIKGDGTKLPSVQFDMNGTLGWATVRIDVNTSGQARATVNGNFGDRVSFSGPIKELSESNIYKGMSI